MIDVCVFLKLLYFNIDLYWLDQRSKSFRTKIIWFQNGVFAPILDTVWLQRMKLDR